MKLQSDCGESSGELKDNEDKRKINLSASLLSVRRYYNPTTKALGRREYTYYLFRLVMLFAFSVVLGLIGIHLAKPAFAMSVHIACFTLLGIAVCLAGYSSFSMILISIKRFHNLQDNWLFAITLLIPYLNVLVFTYLLGFDGDLITETENKKRKGRVCFSKIGCNVRLTIMLLLFWVPLILSQLHLFIKLNWEHFFILMFMKFLFT